MTTKRETIPAREFLEKLVGPLSFAMFMRASRTALDLSQVEMAKKLGVTRATLCDIESGRTNVSIHKAREYAKKAGFSEMVALEAWVRDQLKRIDMDYEILLSKKASKRA